MRSSAPGFPLKFILLGFDLLALIALFGVARLYRFGEFSDVFLWTRGFWFIAVLTVSCLYLTGHFDFSLQRVRISVWPSALLSTTTILSLAIFVNYLFGKERADIFGRGVLVGSTMSFGLWIVLSRTMIRSWQRKVTRKIKFLFIVDAAYRAELERDLMDLRLDAEILDPSSGFLRRVSSGSPLYVQESTLEKTPEQAVNLATQRLHGEPISILSDFYETYLGKLPVASFRPDWFIVSEGFGLVGRPMILRMKRLIDLFGSLVLFLFALPLMILAGIAIKLESPGPVFYQQTRTGRFGEPFTIIKLRTMRHDAEKNGAQWAAVADVRITRVGRSLRKTRIDELPQLWNILKGEMSFCGPRPERPEMIAELSKVIPYYNLRHVVPPGVTGWAQVMYPYGASVDDARRKLEYDLYYVKHAGLMIDLRILARTVRTVLSAGGR